MTPEDEEELRRALPPGWTVEAGGGKLYVYEAGGGRPVASVEELGRLSFGHGYNVTVGLAEGRYSSARTEHAYSLEEAADIITPFGH